MDWTTILNGMLADLGLAQNAEDWRIESPASLPGWMQAFSPYGGSVEAWIEHASSDGCGYTAVTYESAADAADAWAERNADAQMGR